MFSYGKSKYFCWADCSHDPDVPHSQWNDYPHIRPVPGFHMRGSPSGLIVMIPNSVLTDYDDYAYGTIRGGNVATMNNVFITYFFKDYPLKPPDFWA